MKAVINMIDQSKVTTENSTFKYLPTIAVTSIDDLVYEFLVKSIDIEFTTEQDRANFYAANKFVKRLKGGYIQYGTMINTIYAIRFEFNTFDKNKTTGEKNEAAIARRTETFKTLVLQNIL